MNETFAAGALLLLERAFVKPHVSVSHEFSAFRAELSASGVVMSSAVDVDHVFNSSFFSLYPGMLRFSLSDCHTLFHSFSIGP